ncbi:hypothetical protein BEN30_07960 [Magnetovibrio blakemorei]|uniref:Uncharacterized protein n=1 Tax=Magnetovibrio blakemorei TaxID=28181 RepID=A0A1E5Q8Y7_9PROT|nr:hypothetical protein BEN30_07960 [Magnetovibrio blakemorei]
MAIWTQKMPKSMAIYPDIQVSIRADCPALMAMAMGLAILGMRLHPDMEGLVWLPVMPLHLMLVDWGIPV